MQYMGGKCLISNEIAYIINPFTWGGARRGASTIRESVLWWLRH